MTSAFQQLYVDYLERFTPSCSRDRGRACVSRAHRLLQRGDRASLTYRSQHWAAEPRLVMFPPRNCCFSGRPSRPGTVAVVQRPERCALCGRCSALGQLPEVHPRLAAWRGYWAGRALASVAGARWRGPEPVRAEDDNDSERAPVGIRLRAAGCRVIDVTWLSAELAAGRKPEWGTPWWEQLAGRDRDAKRIAVPFSPQPAPL